jgi:predicted GNAT family acetyltransferase
VNGLHPGDVKDNPARSRYELDIGEGETAFASYRATPGVLTIYYTEVPSHRRGRGLGSILVRGALQDVRAKGWKVVPRCGFVAAVIRDNPEFRDLLA